ncbi:ECF transporter S component [Kineococcus terrestris]|uniref:ECF transporter S component n=1 Tax=Kineococcus terrestris TaxID=2044856 RepID=UPI0034DB1CF1
MSQSTESTRPAAPRTVLARAPLGRWRSVDLVTAAVLGVAFGVVFWGWNALYTVVEPAFYAFRPAAGLVVGVWLLPAVVGGLVVRRPGAALLTEMLAASVSLLLANQWGASVLVSGAVQGLGAELVLALFVYRRFGVPAAALAGAASGVCAVAYETTAYYADWSGAWKLAYLGTVTLSGALVAGVGGWLLVRALARTGALQRFPAGAEHRARTRG